MLRKDTSAILGDIGPALQFDFPGQIVAGNQLHQEVRNPFVPAEAVNIDDIGMPERRYALRFFENLERHFAGDRTQPGECLQGDVAIQRRIARCVHATHSTLAEQLSDFDAVECGSRGDRLFG